MAVPQFSAETHPRLFADLPVFLESFILRPPPNTAFYSCLDAFGALRCVLEHKRIDFGVMLRMKGRAEGAGLGSQAVLCDDYAVHSCSVLEACLATAGHSVSALGKTLLHGTSLPGPKSGRGVSRCVFFWTASD